jgi:uncharacterized protein YeaO (DUF488 family)
VTDRGKAPVELRRCYGHDPAKFEEFLRPLAEENGVALVTVTRDVQHAAAEVLRGVLVGPT